MGVKQQVKDGTALRDQVRDEKWLFRYNVHLRSLSRYMYVSEISVSMKIVIVFFFNIQGANKKLHMQIYSFTIDFKPQQRENIKF